MTALVLPGSSNAHRGTSPAADRRREPVYEGDLPDTATALPGHFANVGIDLVAIGLILVVVAIVVLMLQRKTAQ